MYKVFLVDDEIVVREGIRSNFPWEDTDFVLAGEAPDGEIALSMLQDVKPDILITDIRMPFMDGLELCRQVSRSMPWIYIVILSGYDDFAYAREAISLGVKEYLLKPVSGQELRSVLERIALRIQEDKRQQASLKAYREQMASSSRFLKEKLLTELYGGANGERILKSARSMQMNLLANHYLVMLLQPSPEPESEEDMFSAQSVLERLTDGSGGAAHLCRGYGGFSILVLGDNDMITQVIYNLLENATKFARAGSTLYLGVTTIDGKARVTVRNLGDTIPAEELPLLLERFHKSDKSRSEDKDGVGLGLYIVKTILEQHKEKINVTSENGVTTFTFSLAME